VLEWRRNSKPTVKTHCRYGAGRHDIRYNSDNDYQQFYCPDFTSDVYTVEAIGTTYVTRYNG